MLGGRKPKPLLELLSKGFALIILIKANDPSFAILKSELLFGRLPLYKPSIHILLYISISCTSINLHRSWEEKFSPSKNLDVKNIFPNVLYNLYIQKKCTEQKIRPTKNIGRIRLSSSSKATFCGSISIFTTGIRGSRGREPSSFRTSLATQALRRDIGGFNQPIPQKICVSKWEKFPS